MSAEEQGRLMDNIAAPLGTVSKEIQKRMIEHFTKADPNYGKGIKERLGL
jgi:catalase